VTLDNAALCANYADGTSLIGQDIIDSIDTPRPHITNIYLEPSAAANPKALKHIEQADFIIFGPGDLYTSILPNLLVDGIASAVRDSKAKKLFFVNLMTKVGQSVGFKASMFVDEILKYSGLTNLDILVVNNKYPDRKVLDWYKQTAGAELVEDDIVDKNYPHTKVVRADLLSKVVYEQSLVDRVKRSLIRHDSDKVARVLVSLLLTNS
jgi:uncharacterized cofD-like protein